MPLSQYQTHKQELSLELTKLQDGTAAREMYTVLYQRDPNASPYSAPEEVLQISFALSKIQEKINATIPIHQKRMAILDEMHADHVISKEDHELMTKMPVFAEDPEIANYTRIAAPQASLAAPAY